MDSTSSRKCKDLSDSDIGQTRTEEKYSAGASPIPDVQFQRDRNDQEANWLFEYPLPVNAINVITKK
ncbi:hypothetical protein QN362_15580 [Actimicrobium sp. CCC2.4]|nr:hypothetical protein [Actimicrobium sp. CCC2.4]